MESLNFDPAKVKKAKKDISPYSSVVFEQLYEMDLTPIERTMVVMHMAAATAGDTLYDTLNHLEDEDAKICAEVMAVMYSKQMQGDIMCAYELIGTLKDALRK